MSHLLTFELRPTEQKLEIHGDAEGLRILAGVLERLAKQSESGEEAHEHLTTAGWGGWELTEAPQSCDGLSQTINHVKVFAWKNDGIPESGSLRS